MIMFSTMRRLLTLVAVITVTAASVECGAATREVGKETLTQDATWAGEVLVTGDVHVPAGVTLTIAPGTTVRFKKISPESDRNLFGVDSPY